MSVSGLCGLCEAAQAKHACDRCGTLVCNNHFERSRGLCSVCASGERGREGGPSTELR